ncbi:MAG: phosphatase PAP2 family protein [Rhizobiales bacterium]|nr:phosphatase PAP2 family protein [Hyphomicrobiales bacterium]
MYSLDVSVTQAINQIAGKSTAIDTFLIAVSAYGIPILVALVAVQWWRRGDRPAVRHTLVSAGFSFLLGLGINQIVLLVFDRVRPYDAGVTHLHIAPSVDPSFPSDHATAAVAIAVSFLLSCSLRPQGLFLLVAAALVAFSRVYIGIHYASDVLGGALIGALAAIGVRMAYKPDSRLNHFLIRIL